VCLTFNECPPVPAFGETIRGFHWRTLGTLEAEDPSV
jgi:hypothetical protein